MHKRLFGLLASAALAFAACSGSATPTPSATGGASAPPAATGSTPASAPASVAPTVAPLDLGKTAYFTTVTPAGHTGGTLVMAEWQTVATMNPYYAQANADIEAQDPAFDGLLTIGPDLGYIPDMATNIPTVANGGVVVNGAGMDVTWTLKTGMLWSDGTPITCADVDATRAWIMDKAQTGLTGGTVGYENISSIDGGTTTTCVMHFSKTYSAYLLLFGAVLPKAYITSISVADAPTKLYALANPKAAIYSGPYIPTDIKPGSQITYAPNPNWKTIGFGADTTKNHAPYLDKLVFQYFGDAPGMIAAYRNGQIDVAMDLSDSDIDSVKDIPDAQKIIQNALFTESNDYNNASFKAKFGADGAPIILAIMEATDVSAVIAGPMGGSVTRTCNNLAVAGEYYYKAEQCPKTDPADAAAKLDALGWKVNASTGIREKGGVKLSVDYCTTTRPYRIDAITLISSQLKAIGINATVNVKPANPDVFGTWTAEPADTKCNLVHGNFDVAMYGYTSTPDPTTAYSVYTTSGIPDKAPHNGQNVTRSSIPALDAAYATVLSSLDTTTITAAMGTIQDIYGSSQNTFELPFFNHQNVWLLSTKVHNYTGNPTSVTGNWNAGDWWVDQ
jgi:peptide/nickel transport system substrate-binding protein